MDQGKKAGKAPVPAKAHPLLRVLPLIMIAGAAAAFFLSGANRYLSLSAIREHHADLLSFVAENYWSALALFCLAYVAVAALSIPGATLLSALGGFLFGNMVGTAAVVASATVGATILFTAARAAVGGFFRKRAGPYVRRLEEGFSRNAFSYLLLLRLIPAFPFFIINIASAFTRIRVATFFFATLIGIIPGAFAFVSAGNGLGAIFARGDELKLTGLLLEPEILTPIVALSLLALLPFFLKPLGTGKDKSAQ
jgi:uncharacterized membrane protein YdjX (TVP38/TMEM64 family)